MELYDGVKQQSVSEPWFANYSFGCPFFPATPRTNFVVSSNNVVWAAVYNRFFTIIVAPPTNKPPQEIIVRHVKLPPLSPEELATVSKAITNQFGFQTAFVYPELTLAPNQALERRFDVFAGPKEYKTLDRLAAQFGNNMDLVMGFGGFFGFFARLLLLSMNGLHALGLSYALTIIVITVIIKVLFWPLTQMSTRSMKRMQALQPQVKAIQEKYKDDPQKMNQKMMELWKQNKVNQKMMQYMPLIFLFILYNFSSGLTLYWTVQNLLTIAQMKLTKASSATVPTSAKPASPPPKRKK